MDTRFQYSAYRYFLIWGVLSSLVLTFSTFVDATLVGNNVGSAGLAVYNLVTPVFLLYALIGVTTGVGANVEIIRLLGEDKKKEADAVFHKELTLGIILSILSLSPLLFLRGYASFLGVGDELYPLAEEYLTPAVVFSPAFIMYHILSASVRSDGNPRLCAVSSAVICFTIIILDIVLMTVLGMGIRGSAISLGIGETLGVVVLLTHFFRKNRLLTLSLKLPHLEDIREFVMNGFGLGSAYIFTAVVMLFFNAMLLSSGGDRGTFSVAVYGIIYTVGTIPSAVFDGNAFSLQTVVSFLSGESDGDGISAVLKRALVTMVSLSLALALLSFFFASDITRFFGVGGDDASRALTIYLVSIIFASVNTTLTSFWSSIGRTRLSSLMSLMRNCLFLILFGFIFIPQYSINGLGLAYIAGEAASLLLILFVRLKSPSRTYIKEKFGQVEKSFEKTYPIEKESMSEISSDLGRITEEWDIDFKRAFMINFISEEILLNIIKFALSDRGRKEYYISIKLIGKKDDLVLRIRDNVSSYNPFEAEGDEIDSGVLTLIKKKTKYSDYQRKMVFNYFYTVI